MTSLPSSAPADPAPARSAVLAGWLLLALALIAQVNTAVNAIALAMALRSARASYPTERFFIDAEASGAWSGLGAIGLVNLALGILLVILAWRTRASGGRARPVAIAVAAGAVLVTAACIAGNPLTLQWDPDGHELVQRFVPGWHRTALVILAVLAATAAGAAIALLVRTRSPRRR